MFLESLEARDLLAIFVVNSTGALSDSFPDDGICDTANNPLTDPPTPPSGICTLRAAMMQANQTVDDDEIRFAIPGGGVPVIEGQLGGVANGAVDIDGTTQAGGMVEVRDSFGLITDGSTIRGLVLGRGTLTVQGNGNTIVGSFFGTNSSGDGLGDGAAVIQIVGDGNRVGGVVAADRNVIVGRLTIDGLNNHVQGNYIGVDLTGEVALRGTEVAVEIIGGRDNEIGGDSAAKGNVIVGHSHSAAVQITGVGDDTLSHNIVSHNLIGTNKDGSRALGTIGGGILLSNTTDNVIFDNVVAAGRPAEGIPGTGHGVVLSFGTHRTQVRGNKIGTNAAGTVSDPDGVPGNGDEFGHENVAVLVAGSGIGATGNSIGGVTAAEANTISGSEFGIGIVQALDTKIFGNYIGTNAAGDSALPNGIGISIVHSQRTVVGGVGAARNIISGNLAEGVQIAGISAVDNLLANNFIGTNAAGTSALPNDVGVLINGASGNCVGGVVPVASEAPAICAVAPGPAAALLGNLISGNRRYGVQITGGGSDGNIVQANRIGTNAAGAAALGNGWDGVAIEEGADDNRIGGTELGRGNLISGNSGDGVLVIGTASDSASDNLIAGNTIGTDVSGEFAVANGARGIHLDGNVFHTIVGGDTLASRNLISGNRLDGIIVALASTTGNVIKNNFIGTDRAGNEAIPNERNGILVLNSPTNFLGDVIGTDRLGNLIAGNVLSGVRIQGADAAHNTLIANSIGVNADASARLPNQLHGIYIVDSGENVIGNSWTGDPSTATFSGNILSGNGRSGVRMEGTTADGNLIGGNLIGLDRTGTRPLFNGEHGIHVLHASATRIGVAPIGEPALAGNTISANLDGIVIEGASATETLIGDNRVGTDWQGTPSAPPSLLGNTANGIRITDASETYIGGEYLNGGDATTVPRNIVAANGTGIAVLGDTARFNAIRRNSIFDNLQLGIDLGGDGITPNDADTDVSGPNLRRNFPVDLHYRSLDGQVTGRLTSAPNETFTIELFENPTADSTGAGEGKIFVKAVEVTTGIDGIGEFATSFTYHADNPWITATATDGAGNSSEFSGPLLQADLDVASVQLAANQVRKTEEGYVLPLEITVRNIGTATATNARFEVTGNGQPLDASAVVTLEPGETRVLTGTWVLNSLLQANPRGLALLDLIVRADPNDVIEELPAGVNFRSASLTVDARPVITEVRKEYAEGMFLQHVPLESRFEVLVDWNGNLDGVVFTEADLPEFNFQINGVAGLPDGGIISLNSFTPTLFTIGMHDDLRVGGNTILFEARNRLQNFYSDPVLFHFDQIETVPYIESPLWTVQGLGGTYEQTAEYTAKIFLPELATGGFINVPVDRLGVSGGAFGPDLPQVTVTAVLRSNRTSSLDGEFTLEGDLADEDLGGVAGSITAAVHGEFAYDPQLRLDSFSGAFGGDISVKGPKVPLPPAPWIRAQATFGLSSDATLAWTENEQGELELDPDVVLGLEPYGEFALSLMYRGVGIEVAGGAKLRGEFSLAEDPCLFLGGNGELFVRLTASAWIFEASKEIPVLEVPLTGCGAAVAEEGEAAPAATATPTIWGLLPRYVLPSLGVEGEPSAESLPQVAFPYAKPALARHSDGTMTLVYVSEDPHKAVGQQLEIFATHFDGTQWSAPVLVTDDTLLDDAPSVAYDGSGRAIAVWSRLKQSLANPAGVDPQTLIGDLEIVWSSRDPATGIWSPPAALTDDGSMDHLPKIASGPDGQVMTVWTHVDDNHWPLMPDDDTRPLTADLHFATWTGADWSATATAVSGLAAASVPELAIGSGTGLLVWSEDGDRDVTTDTDTSIRAARWTGATWLAAEVIGGNADGIADLTPRVVYGPTGQATIGWVRAGAPVPGDDDDYADQLMAVDYAPDGVVPPIMLGVVEDVSELKLTSDSSGDVYFVWAGTSDAGPDILAARRAVDSQLLSEIQPLTTSPQLEWSLLPFFNSSQELEVIYLERELGTTTVVIGATSSAGAAEAEPGDTFDIPEFLGSSMRSVAHPVSVDLIIESLELATPNPQPGEVVDVNVVVRNQGLLDASAFDVAFLDNAIPGAASQSVPTLVGGGSTQLAFSWTVPANSTAPHVLLARADAADSVLESNEGNNDRSISALQSDLSVTGAYASHRNGQLAVGATISNRGAITIPPAVVIELRLDNPVSGTLIGTAVTPAPLLAGASVPIEFSIASPLANLARVRIGYFRADPGGAIEEFRETNNVAAVLLSPFTSWNNPRNPLDVNFDTQVTPLDALLVINELNFVGSSQLTVPAYPPDFLDTSNDFLVTPLDALLVINDLNQRVFGVFEGEAAPWTTLAFAPEATEGEDASSGSDLVLPLSLARLLPPTHDEALAGRVSSARRTVASGRAPRNDQEMPWIDATMAVESVVRSLGRKRVGADESPDVSDELDESLLDELAFARLASASVASPSDNR